MSSSYVHRSLDGRDGWVGPLRSPAQAEREAAAWRSAGWEAAVHPSTPDVRRAVREWEAAVRQVRTPSGGVSGMRSAAKAALREAIEHRDGGARP